MKRMILAWMLIMLASPAFAKMDDALADIKSTVHGIIATKVEGSILHLSIVNVGADYDFMALVTCRLLREHHVKNISIVRVYDAAKSDAAGQPVLGEYKCATIAPGEKGPGGKGSHDGTKGAGGASGAATKGKDASKTPAP